MLGAAGLRLQRLLGQVQTWGLVVWLPLGALPCLAQAGQEVAETVLMTSPQASEALYGAQALLLLLCVSREVSSPGSCCKMQPGCRVLPLAASRGRHCAN